MSHVFQTHTHNDSSANKSITFAEHI